MSEYGLPDIRDKDGELQAVEHTYEWNGDDVTIKLIPPTIAEYESYEDLGDEAGAGELQEVVDDHLEKPEIAGEPTTAELLCYVHGIVDYCNGGGGFAGEVQEELDQRQDAAPGN
ncbi:hypothetical protein [Halosimplex sp. J119]